MNIRKRILCFTLIVCIFASIFPASSTVSANSYDIFEYYVEYNEVCITQINTFPIGDVAIPDEIEGFPVTAIRWFAFSNCTEMTSIYIPDTVNYIGEGAFYKCTSLESIRLPASLKYVDYGTFYDCTNLKDIYIPKSVEYISGDAFSYCPNIETITVEEGNEYYYSKDNCLIDWEKSALRIGKNNTLPEDGSVTSLYYTFTGRTDITEIVIPECITAIHFYAFEGCTELQKIALPKTLTMISTNAFANCEKLENIQIPASVSYIGPQTFSNCSSLTDIYCVAKSQPEDWDENWLDNETTTVHWGYIPYGDINGDGEIDLTDYTMAKRIVMETYVLAYSNSNPADVNGDNVVTANDYILIKRHVMQTYTLI